jgi:NAD(P)-dependent dehydrogenase (short-subunit alcohol dehydrogenase family)
MTTMAVIGITGSTDGIGRAAARVLLADGHRVLVHGRCRERGEPVAKALGGDVALVVVDLVRIDDVRRLADQAREHCPIDVWGAQTRAYGAGQHAADLGGQSRDDLAVNVLAPAPTCVMVSRQGGANVERGGISLRDLDKRILSASRAGQLTQHASFEI